MTRLLNGLILDAKISGCSRTFCFKANHIYQLLKSFQVFGFLVAASAVASLMFKLSGDPWWCLQLNAVS